MALELVSSARDIPRDRSMAGASIAVATRDSDGRRWAQQVLVGLNIALHPVAISTPEQLGDLDRCADTVLLRTDGLDSWTKSMIGAASGSGGLFVIVVADAGDGVDRLMALELGADDFQLSTSDPREIAARLAALRRRSRGVRAETPDLDPETPVWMFNDISRTLRSPSGSVCDLTRQNADLLNDLVTADQGVVGHGLSGVALSNFRTAVSRLRRQVQARCGQDLPLRNVWGSGYSFDGVLRRTRPLLYQS